MGRRKSPAWVWQQVWWPQPLDPDLALEFLERIVADRHLGVVDFEVHAMKGRVSYIIGSLAGNSRTLRELTTSMIPGSRMSELEHAPRAPLMVCARLKISHPALALNTDRVTAVSRAVLAGLAMANGKGETVVLQVLIGARRSPSFVPADGPDPTQRWFDLVTRGTRPASPDVRHSLRHRAAFHSARVTVRLGASAASLARTRLLLTSVLGGLRVAQSAGVRITVQKEQPSRLAWASIPWRWPLQLATKELIDVLGWPLDKYGTEQLPGHPPVHPKVLAPGVSLVPSTRPFAVATAPGAEVQVGIGASDSLQHTWLLGPTASGKSTAMLAMILDAARSGRGILVIDPKSDLVNDVLARIPDDRADDVVVIDPTDPRPVGINPLRGSARHASITADSILAVFKELSGDAWGPRTEDVLMSGLLTLAHHPGATLPMLPALLTDERFRHSLTQGLTDQVGLGSFWASYEAMSPQMRAQVIAPTLTRLRQFLLRPQLRAVLGQAEPGFDLIDLFTKRRIVLVSLNRGQIGAEGARLLGSLIVGQLWPLVLARAGLPPERRRIVNVYIDEVQDYLALPTDLEDALSQARSLGVGFTVAHQYRRQLPPGLRSAVDTNARNKVVFGLNAEDAAEVAKQAPQLEAQDFIYLPRFAIYTNLIQGGSATGWFSARTLPPEAPVREPVALRARSASLYGRDASAVEDELLAHHTRRTKEHRVDDGLIGRRPAGGGSS